MISEATVETVSNLLAVDPGATEEERDWVLLALKGPDIRITAKEAARRLGVSKPTLFRCLRDGASRLSRVRENRKMVYYSAREVGELIANGEGKR